MLKFSYIITLLSGIGLFNSCAGSFIDRQDISGYSSYDESNTVYGNYLAARVAQIRQDYNIAANYYIKAMEKGFVNNEILEKTYIILASQGQIDKAVKYASEARQNGDKNNFIDILFAVHAFKQGNYKLARSFLMQINESTYNKLITPLFNAWSYVGENDYKNAILEIDKISSSDEMKTVYALHRGLIEEQFNNFKEAEKFYDKIIDDRSTDISFRALQIITNFMIRQDKKNKALSLTSRYYGASNMKEMLLSLNSKIKKGNKNTPSIIDNSFKGVSEVFLEVALLLKLIPVGYDYAQMYISISQYFNDDNDIAKIAMADIYEEHNMYDKANNYYDLIDKESDMYYPAQIKKANNLSNEAKYEQAVSILKQLLKKHPNNFQILSTLGDISRVSDNQSDAINYYNQAIKSLFYESEKHWPLYYALAVSYDKSNNWLKAEENLMKALDLSNRHPQVLNYLGYSWLRHGINVNKAASFILEAYEKEPNDGIIIDSLGWVYFKTGDYKNAIIYLEKASELNPQNAIISDHLGDAYWLGGRKNEAIFLWKQALLQKEDREDLNRKQVKHKIENGLRITNSLTIDDEKLMHSLQNLSDITD